MTPRLPPDTRDDLSRAFTLSPVAPSVSAARLWVRQMLNRWHLDELRWAAEILVTELMANAIKHARTGGAPITVLLMYAAGTLRIEVRDRDANRMPTPREPAVGDESGWGLILVATYADRWGTKPTTTGKAVWCELDTPSPRGEALR
jgi:anti-sigma regulatory factor (Ser/Thr protein kinase)